MFVYFFQYLINIAHIDVPYSAILIPGPISTTPAKNLAKRPNTSRELSLSIRDYVKRLQCKAIRGVSYIIDR